MVGPTRPGWWLAWAAGLASAGVLAAILAAIIVITGAFNTTASTPHIRLVARLSHTTMAHFVRIRARNIQAPPSFSAEQVAEGLSEYDEHCVACHGGPATARAAWASAMTPTPPYLLDAVRHWSPAELYFIVRNGVKMTAMPAWGEVETDQHIWSMVAFLEAMPRMSAADYLRMRRAQASDADANRELPKTPDPASPQAS
jgi:mono/diheme cytochrome c family protein